ncbi:hypothetical protein PoB_004902000 [Plakobranchus ocellatus]|uniref:Uncharacterized protein n=1 Tax=Plakobranchus ocellatus TaxID=259542 RepID=A0AAV4BTQ4_9GAST|nr:hypothetical protein PoB_004902000 [Plakobranchus ocellatus]
MQSDSICTGSHIRGITKYQYPNPDHNEARNQLLAARSQERGKHHLGRGKIYSSSSCEGDLLKSLLKKFITQRRRIKKTSVLNVLTFLCQNITCPGRKHRYLP